MCNAVVFGAGDFRTPTEHRPKPPVLHSGDALRLGPLPATVLAVLALATVVEGPKVKIIAAAAITFVIMRIAFWIGYRIKPVHRAFGFASTFYMNLGLLAGAIWLGFR